MRIFIYDSSFEGLLTSIYDAYYSKEKPDKIYSSTNYTYNLIDDVIYINTDISKFEKVYNAIENKISKISLRNIYYCYLSETVESANLIYDYIRLGFKLGSEVNLYKHNDIVINIESLAKKVSFEGHRFTGLVRFNEINSILYSSIEPDYNILPILAKHFSERLSNEYFIINDTRRDIALVYDRENFNLKPLSTRQKDLIINNMKSDEYEVLWKQYFSSTNIVERENTKLQKRQMPLRYWKNLTELL